MIILVTVTLVALPRLHWLQVIDLVLAYDGDVMKFAGDSMIVAFSPKDEEHLGEDHGLKAATLRCVNCSAALAEKFGELLAVTLCATCWRVVGAAEDCYPL